MKLGAKQSQPRSTSAYYKQHKWRQLYGIHSILDQDNRHKPKCHHTDNEKPNTKNRENLYGHVMQIEDCGTARQVAEWNPPGKRRQGRPVNTWKDGIWDSMQRRNLKDQEEKLHLWIEENCVFSLSLSLSLSRTQTSTKPSNNEQFFVH
jgi:hypothetical protein